MMLISQKHRYWSIVTSNSFYILLQTLMFEVRNPDGSWPRKITIKLCIYPNTDDIKLWSFDVFDTVGMLK